MMWHVTKMTKKPLAVNDWKKREKYAHMHTTQQTTKKIDLYSSTVNSTEINTSNKGYKYQINGIIKRK